MKKLYVVLVSVMVLLLMSGCDDKVAKTLRIGISPWPGYEPMVLAMEKNLYQDLDVKIIRFATPSESFRALRDGIIDVAAFTADEVLHYAQVREKPKMFLILDISNGGDAIVAQPEIKSLDDLKHKSVYIESSALGDYVINRAMDFTSEVTIEQVNVNPVEIGRHVEVFKNKKADAVVTYEPFKSQMIAEGGHVIFDSKQIPQEIVDVLVTNDHVVDEKREELRKFVDGWYAAIDYIKHNRDESMERMAFYEKIPKEAFEQSFDELIIPTRSEVTKMLGGKQSEFTGAIERLAELMQQKGSIEKKVNTSLLLEASIVSEE